MGQCTYFRQIGHFMLYGWNSLIKIMSLVINNSQETIQRQESNWLVI